MSKKMKTWEVPQPENICGIHDTQNLFNKYNALMGHNIVETGNMDNRSFVCLNCGVKVAVNFNRSFANYILEIDGVESGPFTIRTFSLPKCGHTTTKHVSYEYHGHQYTNVEL